MINFNEYREVYSLGEYIDAINSFACNEILWYRGHEDIEFKLVPTLYRDKKADFIDDINTYNSLHMAENIRIQQYYARNHPFIRENGVNTTEWLGMAQHYGIKTRFLDWSTSAIHSLIFALEKYFDEPDYVQSGIPCVWILRPQRLNRIITEHIVDEILSGGLLDKLLSHYFRDSKKRSEIETTIKDTISKCNGKLNVFLESNPENKWGHLDYIYNLSYFDRLLGSAKNNPEVYFSMDNMNPIYFILAMIYREGFCCDDKLIDMTPLAVIHPLNSDRIKEQRGVFTVFPFPSKDLDDGSGSLEYMRMEFNPDIKGTLCKVCIMNPKRIYKELRTLGIHKNWLYFEHNQISSEIETGI